MYASYLLWGLKYVIGTCIRLLGALALGWLHEAWSRNRELFGQELKKCRQHSEPRSWSSPMEGGRQNLSASGPGVLQNPVVEGHLGQLAIHKHLHLHVHIRVHLHIRCQTHTCTHNCVRIYIYMYTHMYIYKYTYV